MKRIHIALFTPVEDEERSGYTISFPDFPDKSNHTYTRTLQTGYEIAKKELTDILNGIAELGMPFNEPLTIKEIELQPKQVAAYIPLSVDVGTE